MTKKEAADRKRDLAEMAEHAPDQKARDWFRRPAGVQVMICTGRECEAVRRRAADLHIDYVFQNVKDKAAFLRDFMAEHGLSREEVAYCGDDWNDLPAMALCGFVACPADASPEVLARADCRCSLRGYIYIDQQGSLFPSDMPWYSLETDLNSLPPVRYILPIPSDAISRSNGTYVNYYGY